MKVTRVSPSNVGLIWQQVEPILRPGFDVELTDENPDSVRKEVCAGRAQLWIVHDGSGVYAAGITRVNTVASGRRICFCVVLGGERMERWLALLDKEASAFAKDYGCHSIRISGRVGWKRVMKPLGYAEPFCILEKVL